MHPARSRSFHGFGWMVDGQSCSTLAQRGTGWTDTSLAGREGTPVGYAEWVNLQTESIALIDRDGTLCDFDACGAPQRLIAAHWQPLSHTPKLANVSRSHNVDAMFAEPRGEDPHNVVLVVPDDSRGDAWSSRFDGQRWHELRRKPPEDGPSLVGMPAMREGRPWQHVTSQVATTSGDLWITVSGRTRDCGLCYVYDALLRIPNHHARTTNDSR